MFIRNEATEEEKQEKTELEARLNRNRKQGHLHSAARTNWEKTQRNEKIALGALAVFLIALNIAVLVGAFYVLVTSILDMNQNGMHFWNVAWAIIAALVLIGFFTSRGK